MPKLKVTVPTDTHLHRVWEENERRFVILNYLK